MEEKPTRPFGVTVLAVLNLIGGLLAVIGGLGLLLLSAIGAPIPMLGLILFPIAIIGLAGLVVGILQLVVAYGLWTGRMWAWRFAFLLAILNIISIIWRNLIGLIIGIIVIYYLTGPYVKKFFNVQ